ncbi:hypothetical protein B0H13DRAFT_1875996 [Mycena leptocephala]|nr:hypothetical protein B0H13DRAFT_1875996 [Mycena leptocephala]
MHAPKPSRNKFCNLTDSISLRCTKPDSQNFFWSLSNSDPYQGYTYDVLYSDDLGKWGKYLWPVLLEALEERGYKGSLTMKHSHSMTSDVEYEDAPNCAPGTDIQNVVYKFRQSDHTCAETATSVVVDAFVITAMGPIVSFALEVEPHSRKAASQEAERFLKGASYPPKVTEIMQIIIAVNNGPSVERVDQRTQSPPPAGSGGGSKELFSIHFE